MFVYLLDVLYELMDVQNKLIRVMSENRDFRSFWLTNYKDMIQS
jgi:hypothetical protein